MFSKIAKILLGCMVLLMSFSANPTDSHGRRFFKRADFGKVVFIGDSLTAGFQSGGLSVTGQTSGYANRLAQQAGFPLTLPLVSEDGIPPKLMLVSADPIQIVQSSSPGDRINPLEQATNLAVPGHTVNDALFKAPPINPFDDLITYIILGQPGLSENPPNIRSQVEWAEALEPTFAFIWIGNNDVLGFATSGGQTPITPFADFTDDYKELLDRMQATGADLIVANIPYVTSSAFFLSAQEVAAVVGADLSDIGLLLDIESGDLVSIQGLELVEQILVGTLPPGLPDELVLDRSEAEKVRNAIDDFNLFIAHQCHLRNIPLVNMNLLFQLVEFFGVPTNGKLLNTRFLGGLFSLDGIHPTETGYAVVANHFIRTLNWRYRAHVPRIDINEVAAADPLVIPELLPDTRDVLRAIIKEGFGDKMRQFKEVLSGRLETVQ